MDNEAVQQPKQTADALSGMHALPMDVGLQLRISRWRTLWREEQRWPWADSLAYTYLRYERIDSALRYARWLVAQADRAALRKGALHVYNAHRLHVDSSQQRSLGEEARQHLTAALRHYPNEYALRVKAALTHLRGPAPMRGIRILQQLHKEAPDDPDVLFSLGRLSLQTGQYQKGEEKLKKLLRLHPKHLEGLLYLGRYLMQNERASEGRSLLVRAKVVTTQPAVLQMIDSYLKGN